MLTYSTTLFVMAGMLLAFTKDAQITPVVVESSEPQSVTMVVFGQSETGREITGYEIGSGQECILMFGGIHGSERGTVELMEKLVDEIAAQPELVPSDKKLIVIPLANPDGYFDREDKLNANGVNLNRNFATEDWVIQEGDADTYAGLEPFSEIESRVLRDVANTCDPTMMIAFHSQGALVSPVMNISTNGITREQPHVGL
jgi:murein tripeptide amidase MpaA